MLEIGQFNKLKVKRETINGVYLDSQEGEILLPKKYITKEIEIGDALDVFVYKDSEDRYIATTANPKAVVGEFAYLEVKDVNKYGAFLDWGLEKELLVPYSEQSQNMIKGKKYIVRVRVDNITKRIVATTKINKFIEMDDINLKEKEEVDIMVCEFNDLGIKVIINNLYFGLLYKNEVHQNLKIGDKLKGYIKKIREDNKIDVSLTKGGHEERETNKNKVIEILKENGDFLKITDKSSPEEIKNTLQMSKNTFKKTVGALYKQGIIEILDEGLRLKK